MLAAVFKALADIFTEPLSEVLIKSVVLAVALLVAIFMAHGSLTVTLGGGLFAAAVMLMPAVTALVASFSADEIADLVERSHYPADPPGEALPLWRAAFEGAKTAFLAVAVYLGAAPLLLIGGAGVVLFFVATAWLLGRGYFELAAMRLHRVEDAKALRRIHRGTVFMAGLFIAGFVSIPILNLATPLFGTALMVHVHKRIVGTRQNRLQRGNRTSA
jgi:CysZ protein